LNIRLANHTLAVAVYLNDKESGSARWARVHWQAPKKRVEMFQKLLEAIETASESEKPERLEEAVRAILTHLAEIERLRKISMVGG
jgi:hypothetical protein